VEAKLGYCTQVHIDVKDAQGCEKVDYFSHINAIEEIIKQAEGLYEERAD
jgi:hypothetical protein